MRFHWARALVCGLALLSSAFSLKSAIAHGHANDDLLPIGKSFTAREPGETRPTWFGTSHDSEPFGGSMALAPQGALWVKWRQVEAEIRRAAPALARCRANIRHCSTAALRFSAIIKQAAARGTRERLALVNRRVNAAIRYTTDSVQWHAADVWSAPLDAGNKGSFNTGLGDCEDYAIAKYVALRDAGTPAEDLRLLMVWDNQVRTYHAVLAARDDGKWLILDNRWSRLIEDGEASFLTPLFALNAEGVRRFAATRPTLPRSEQGKNSVQSILIFGRPGTMPGYA